MDYSSVMKSIQMFKNILKIIIEPVNTRWYGDTHIGCFFAVVLEFIILKVMALVNKDY